MKKTQDQYKVVMGMDAQDLKNSVELLMNRGWVCTGGIFANGSSYLMQAMVYPFFENERNNHE
jgi:hypothetical protein